MSGVILTDVKTNLGLLEGNTSFDADITLHINSILSDLAQLGVGPDTGFALEEGDETWVDLLGEGKLQNNVISYMFLRTKLLWDSGTMTGRLIESYEKQIEKAEWRITVHTMNPNVTSVSVIDGGHP